MVKRALLIGINKYQIPGADLRGCVNDVKLLQSALVDVYGFPKSDIAVLTDEDATKKAIQAGITRLVKGSRAGDVVVLHFSGHGSNIPDSNGDEADSNDQIICPTNLDWNDPMRDDWLRGTLDTIKAGVHLTVIMDCCYSGTNTRALLPPDAAVISRYLPSPWGLIGAESRARPRTLQRSALRRSSLPARKRKDVLPAELPEMLVTACRDNQIAADALIEGKYSGALTFALVDAIRARGPRITYRELQSETLARLTKHKFEQVPQVEGPQSRLDLPAFVGTSE